MKWINASDRMPENGTIVFVKAVRDKPYNDIFKAAMLSENYGFITEYHDFFHKSNCEWLDESEDSEAVEWVNIQDNSDGIRSFLDELKIEWKPNEHGTLVPSSTDLYWLGRQAERFKISTEQKKS